MIDKITRKLNMKIILSDTKGMKPMSYKSVICICPHCHIEFKRAYQNITKSKNTLCKECSYYLRGLLRVYNNYLDNVMGDFKCIGVTEGKKLIIECNICKNTKIITTSGFKNNVSHKMCGKDLDMYGTRFYRIWANMRTRTNNSNYEKWKHYGGKGISSESWKYFADFYRDMYASYLTHVNIFGEKDTTLDRLDNSKNYNKNNCKWSTLSEQASNKTNANICEVINNNTGDKIIVNNLKEYCREQEIEYTTIIVGLKKSSNYYVHKKRNITFRRIN